MSVAHPTNVWSFSDWAVLALMILPVSGWGATESATEKSVATATFLQGNGGSGFRLTAFSLQLVKPVVYAGAVSSLTGLNLVDANAVWAEEQFNGTNGVHYVEFDSGIMADVVRTAGAVKTLVLAGTLPVAPVVGSGYRIHKHFTIADVFGKNNEAGLTPGSNGNEADNVILHVAQTQETLTLFYSNFPNFTGWYQDDYSPAGNLVVYPEQGLMVRSKSARDTTLLLHGLARKTPTVVPVFVGYNLVGTLNAVGSRKLSELNLYTGNPNTGLAAGSNPAAADNLVLINPDSTTVTYFYSNFQGFEGWFDSAFRSASNVSIAAGAAFYIQRKQPRGLFFWTLP